MRAALKVMSFDVRLGISFTLSLSSSFELTGLDRAVDSTYTDRIGRYLWLNMDLSHISYTSRESRIVRAHEFGLVGFVSTPAADAKPGKRRLRLSLSNFSSRFFLSSFPSFNRSNSTTKVISDVPAALKILFRDRNCAWSR